MLTLLIVMLASFGLGVLLLIAFIAATEQTRSGLQVETDAFLTERFGYVYLTDHIRNIFLWMFACTFSSLILAPLGFLELAVRYTIHRFRKPAAPAALA